MKQVDYWDLSEILDSRVNLDFSILEYEEEVKNTLLMADIITYCEDKCNLSKKALELNMDDIENILCKEEFELVFPTMAEVAL